MLSKSKICSRIPTSPSRLKLSKPLGRLFEDKSYFYVLSYRIIRNNLTGTYRRVDTKTYSIAMNIHSQKITGLTEPYALNTLTLDRADAFFIHKTLYSLFYCASSVEIFDFHALRPLAIINFVSSDCTRLKDEPISQHCIKVKP